MMFRRYANGEPSRNPVPSLIEGVETIRDECSGVGWSFTTSPSAQQL